MIKKTIAPQQAQRFYDRLGARYDWTAFYEAEAKRRGVKTLSLEAGQKLLNIGCGTGKTHQRLQQAVAPAMAVGLDLSAVMARLTFRRTGSPVCQATAWQLPLVAGNFDRLFSSYVLDLIPFQYLPAVLAEFHRVLAPGGRMVIIALTEGTTTTSRALVAAWKAVYAVAPVACGGCRPLQLSSLVEAAGFNNVSRQVVLQLGVPSEIISASR